MAVVDSDVDAWDYAIAELFEALLWDIKENVWRLGYTSGYKYGAHDGEDHEIISAIAQSKDTFAAAV